MSYFIAIPIDDSIQEVLKQRNQVLNQYLPTAVPTQSRKYHVTLIFMDMADETTLKRLMEAMDNVSVSAFQIRTSKLGLLSQTYVYELKKQPLLNTLQRKLVKQCLKRDITLEERKYHPHLTLGRVKEPVKIHPRTWLNGMDDLIIPVNRIVLYQSKGGEYIPIYEKTLSAEPKQYVYILKCQDGTYYTGWTNHLEKRISDHQAGRGAKYTKSRLPVELVYYEEYDNKQTAMRREYACKQMTRKEKELLIKSCVKRSRKAMKFSS